MVLLAGGSGYVQLVEPGGNIVAHASRNRDFYLSLIHI